MFTTHRQRDPLAGFEEADALFGAEQAGARTRIRQATGLKAAEVKAALAAARISPQNRQSLEEADYPLDLDQLAVPLAVTAAGNAWDGSPAGEAGAVARAARAVAAVSVSVSVPVGVYADDLRGSAVEEMILKRHEQEIADSLYEIGTTATSAIFFLMFITFSLLSYLCLSPLLPLLLVFILNPLPECAG